MPPKKKLPEVKASEGTIRVPAIIELSSSDSAAQFGKITEKLDLIQAGQKDLATRVRKIEDSFPILQFAQQLLSGRFEKIEKALPVMQKNQSDLLAQVEKIGKTLSPNDPSDPSDLDNGNLFELFRSVRDVKSLINRYDSIFKEMLHAVTRNEKYFGERAERIEQTLSKREPRQTDLCGVVERIERDFGYHDFQIKKLLHVITCRQKDALPRVEQFQETPSKAQEEPEETPSAEEEYYKYNLYYEGNEEAYVYEEYHDAWYGNEEDSEAEAKREAEMLELFHGPPKTRSDRLKMGRLERLRDGVLWGGFSETESEKEQETFERQERRDVMREIITEIKSSMSKACCEVCESAFTEECYLKKHHGWCGLHLNVAPAFDLNAPCVYGDEGAFEPWDCDIVHCDWTPAEWYKQRTEWYEEEYKDPLSEQALKKNLTLIPSLL
ncbi:hypothetical protein W97_06234 [Coniosporium apollinis CBS 100218]|uniref:Uncharacterized protein n=1 Tax=Coniosporium apollinis (strain CBS 100218) TaxID=1168221 RepID=R7YY48_CONA1|nr:uncharacterized protein W97_06234 [Coniosporium apollinis CBS 100218]EON66832.1 hypothetical protein W97_06234 [Coniosporium apollinis CBS 100218]